MRDDASRGCNTRGGGTQSEAIYGRHADLFMSVLMHEQPPPNPSPLHTHLNRPQALSSLLFLLQKVTQVSNKARKTLIITTGVGIIDNLINKLIHIL